MGASQSNELAGKVIVNIATERHSYRAGDVVRGYVQLTVLQDNTVMRTVVVTLTGIARTTVGYEETHTHGVGKNKKTTRKRKTAHQDSALVALQACVATFPNDRAPPGTCQLPFEFRLPLECSTSMQRFGFGRDTGAILYSVGVLVHRPGWTKQNLVHRVPIDVVARDPPPTEPQRLEADVSVKKCCCCNAGMMQLGGWSDRTAYKDGEEIMVECEVNNLSKQPVEYVDVRLVQHLHFRAQNHGSHIAPTILANIRLLGVEMGHSIGYGNTQTPPTRARIPIPQGIPVSILAPTIQVSCCVQVQSKTKSSLVSDPILQLSITIHRSTSLRPQDSLAAFDGPVEGLEGGGGGGGEGDVPWAVPVDYNPDPSVQIKDMGVMPPDPPPPYDPNPPPYRYMPQGNMYNGILVAVPN